MVIIGGMGSILGSFLGAAFIMLLPDRPERAGALGERRAAVHVLLVAARIDHVELELIVFGGLIIFFLIVEPHGLARLWQIGKEKLRLWPFPH